MIGTYRTSVDVSVGSTWEKKYSQAEHDRGELEHDFVHEALRNIVEAEESLVGLLIVAPSAWNAPELAEFECADFCDPANQKLFARMAAMHEEGIPLDGATLPAELSAHGELELVGGLAQLGKLTERAGMPHHVGYYATRVAETASTRPPAVKSSPCGPCLVPA